VSGERLGEAYLDALQQGALRRVRRDTAVRNLLLQNLQRPDQCDRAGIVGAGSDFPAAPHPVVAATAASPASATAAARAAISA